MIGYNPGYMHLVHTCSYAGYPSPMIISSRFWITVLVSAQTWMSASRRIISLVSLPRPCMYYLTIAVYIGFPVGTYSIYFIFTATSILIKQGVHRYRSFIHSSS